MRRVFVSFLSLLMGLAVQAQPNEVSLVVTGEGATKEEATNNALRSAVEQAFGVFVSANTDIMNDEIVKDEIATISSGNVKSFDEIAYIETPSGEKSITLQAVVSIGNLIEYSKNHGSRAEFSGALFGENLRLREQRKKDEPKVIGNYLKQMMLEKDLFDARIEVDGRPFLYEVNTFPIAPNLVEYVAVDGNYKRLSFSVGVAPEEGVESDKMYILPTAISLYSTEKGRSVFQGLKSILNKVSLSPEELAEYKEENISYYALEIGLTRQALNMPVFYFRNYLSVILLADLSRLLSARLINDWVIEIEMAEGRMERLQLRAPSWKPFIRQNRFGPGYFPIAALEKNSLNSIYEYCLRENLRLSSSGHMHIVFDDETISFDDSGFGDDLLMIAELVFYNLNGGDISFNKQDDPLPEAIAWTGYPNRLMRAVGNIKQISEGKLQLALVPMDSTDPIVLNGDDNMWNDYGSEYPAEFSFHGEEEETFRSCFPVTKAFNDGDLIYSYRVRIPFSQEKIAKIKSVAVKGQ